MRTDPGQIGSPPTLTPSGVSRTKSIGESVVAATLVAMGAGAFLLAFTGDSGVPLTACLFGAMFAVTFGVVYFCVVVPSTRLKESLASLRPLKGRSQADVFGVLGKPLELRCKDERREVRATWTSPRFRFTLGFRDSICTGLVHARDDG